jgi:thioredoxin 1
MKKSIFRSLVATISLTYLFVITVNAQIVKHASTVEQLKKIISENEFVVIDIYASWCRPCRAMSPTLDKVALEYKDVVIVKVNLDSINKSALNTLVGQTVQSIPLLVFFKNGKKVKSIGGQQKLAQLKIHIKSSFNLV